MVILSSEQKLLYFLLQHSEDFFSINQIAKATELNYRIAFEKAKNLEQEKLINIKRIGNSNLCQFNYNFNEQIFIIEKYKELELLKDKNLYVLDQYLSEINNPFFICLVFGSYASKKQTANSDIDLCIISSNEKLNQLIEQKLKLLPLRIHVLEFSLDEFTKMLKTTEQNVAKEILKNRVILKGVEAFYELINNAR